MKSIKNRTRNLALAAAASVAMMTLPALTPAQTTPFYMSPTRSRLVVLIHGITSEPMQALDESIDTSLHGRYYWGEDFIRGLMGTTQESQFDVVQPTWGSTGKTYLNINPKDSWNSFYANEHYVFDRDASSLAPIVIPKPSGLWFPGTQITNETTILNALSQQGTQGANPTTSVMVTYRDGSKHLMPQVGEAVTQIYHTYMKTYGKLPEDKQPQLYLVGHSFGGIIARAIAANPTGADLWGNKLTAEQRQYADFIRKRTVLISTMGTPHTGTPSPDLAQDLAGFVRNAQSVWNAIFEATDSEGPDLFNLGLREAIENTGRDVFGVALNEIAGERQCLNDILRMNEYNQGILHPDTMRRSADGSYIPIYTMGGRSPGSMFMDRSRQFDVNSDEIPYDSWDLIGGSRFSTNAIALHAMSSLLYRQGYGKEAKRPWGTAVIPEGDKVASPYQGFGPSSTRSQSAPLMIDSAMIAATISDTLHGGAYRVGYTDGEYDNDGFVGFDSAHGIGLAGPNWYRVYPKSLYSGFLPWDIDNHGSMQFNVGNGLWIRNELLGKAGFIASSQSNRLSLYPLNGIPATPKVNVKVEILGIYDTDNNLDTFSGADFWVGTRIADMKFSANGADDSRYTSIANPFIASGIQSTVIPIMISVAERDNPSLGDPDDLCAITPAALRDNLYIYLDTRTGRFFGDMEGVAGETYISKKYNSNITNRADLKFRITFEQTAG